MFSPKNSSRVLEQFNNIFLWTSPIKDLESVYAHVPNFSGSLTLSSILIKNYLTSSFLYTRITVEVQEIALDLVIKVNYDFIVEIIVTRYTW